MLILGSPVLTERLVLRAFESRDLDALHAMQSDPDVIRYVPWPSRTRQESQAWMDERRKQDRLAAEGDAVAWAVARSSDDELIGSVNLWWRSVAHAQGEVGFAFARDAHGHGYAGEATSALLDLAFESLDLHRISGRADARNEPSCRLMARLGMRREAHLHEDEFFEGEWTDTAIYAVLRTEWQSLREATTA